MKIGIFGTGIMADIYGGILSQRNDVSLVGIVGNTEEKTRVLAEKYKCQAFVRGDYKGFFQQHKVDAVIVATPEAVRLEPVKAAVENGCHILLEKPFADNYATSIQLREVLHQSKKHVAICHVLRYSPRFFGLATAIEAGQIGEVRQIYARRNSNNKRVLRVLGHTDLAFWLSPHDLDIMRWVTKSEVEWVFASARNQAKSADDYMTAHIKFKSGVDAVLEISWCSPPVSGVAREAIFEVRGTQGVAELCDSDMNLNIFKDGSAVHSVDTYEDYFLHGVRSGFFLNLIDGFVRDVQLGKTEKVAIKDGFETIRMASMIRKSLDEHRIVYAREFAD